MCKCVAGQVACCCCSCAMSLFISVLSILIVIAIILIVALYFGLYNVDDEAPQLAQFVNKTRDQAFGVIKDATKDGQNRLNL